MTSINHKFTKAIEATNNPLAPIILQEAYGRANQVGAMLSCVASKAEVQSIADRLLKDYSDVEIDKLCATPEFIIALCGLLTNALLAYAREL